MKRKLFFITASLITFAACFLMSVLISDYFYARHLRLNIRKVKPGMTKNEAIDILGKPDNIQMSDISGTYWCYNTNSITQALEPQPEILCEHLLLEMRNDGIVEKVFKFRK